MATGWLWEERYAWHDAGTWNDFDSDAAPSRTCSRERRLREPRDEAPVPQPARRHGRARQPRAVARPAGHGRGDPARAHARAPRARACARRRPAAMRATARRWAASATRSPSLAAGGSIVAADAVLDGTVDNAYALVRPPGHHAEPGAVDGLLRVLEHRHRDPARAAGARRRAHRGRRLGRPPRQRHRDDLPLRSERARDLAAPGRALPAGPRARRRRRRGRGARHQPQHPAPAGQRHRGLRPTPSSASSCPRCARSGPS